MNEALIETLETAANALGKCVYELRQRQEPDTVESINAGPRALLAAIVNKCANIQRKLGLGNVQYNAQPDSLTNDLLYVSAVIEQLHKHNGLDDLQKKLEATQQDAAAKESTLSQIHELLKGSGLTALADAIEPTL